MDSVEIVSLASASARLRVSGSVAPELSRREDRRGPCRAARARSGPLRPVRGHADYRTPIDDLYLCGAGTHPGGGVSGANGRNCAREVIRDARGPTARLRARLRGPDA